MKNRYRLIMSPSSIQRLIYAVGFLEMVGVMLILPLFVVHLRHLGLSPIFSGLVRSFYGVLQLVSSPLVGRWSDRWGRRVFLLVSLAVSGLSYLALGASHSLWVLITSRIVSGVFKHSTALCKGVLADVTPPTDRTAVMGNLNAAMGVAFILGPVVGGHLATLQDGFTLVCRLGATIFFFTWGLCYVLLPSELPRHSRLVEEPKEEEVAASTGQPHHSPVPPNTLTRLINYLNDIDWKLFGDIFLVDFFLTFAVHAHRNSFVLVIDELFGASPTSIGYIMSLQGTVGAVSGVFAGRVGRLYGNPRAVLFHSSLALAAALTGFIFAPSVLLVTALLVPLSVGTTFTRTTTSAILIDRCPPAKIGAVTGFAESILAVSTMTTPLITGLVQEVSIQGPSVLAALFACLGAGLAGVMTVTRRR